MVNKYSFFVLVSVLSLFFSCQFQKTNDACIRYRAAFCLPQDSTSIIVNAFDNVEYTLKRYTKDSFELITQIDDLNEINFIQRKPSTDKRLINDDRGYTFASIYFGGYYFGCMESREKIIEAKLNIICDSIENETFPKKIWGFNSFEITNSKNEVCTRLYAVENSSLTIIFVKRIDSERVSFSWKESRELVNKPSTLILPSTPKRN